MTKVKPKDLSALTDRKADTLPVISPKTKKEPGKAPVLTTLAFASLKSARQALIALNNLEIGSEQITMAITNRSEKSSELLKLETMAGRKSTMIEMIGAAVSQGGIEIQEKIKRLEQVYQHNGLVFQVSSEKALASRVVYILSITGLHGAVIIPPPLGSHKGKHGVVQPIEKEVNEETGRKFAVIMTNSENTQQALRDLRRMGETSNVHLFSKDAVTIKSLLTDHPKVAGEVLMDSKDYLDSHVSSRHSRSASKARKALDNGAVVVELNLAKTPNESAIHVLSSYALNGDVIISPPSHRRKPKS
jgi:hypothetical protein